MCKRVFNFVCINCDCVLNKLLKSSTLIAPSRFQKR